MLGKHSGRHAVQKRCEQLGVTLSRFELDRVYRQMVNHADAHKHVSDAQLRTIIDEVKASEAAGASAPAPAAPPRVRPDLHGSVTEPGYGHGV